MLQQPESPPPPPPIVHFFVRQQHSIQIIQLVEAPAPPPRIPSAIPPSSSAPSSCPSSSDDDDDEDVSSYCSSLITPGDSSHNRDPIPWTDDTYNTRMKRVHDWRDGYVKATCEACPLPLKRKMPTQHHPDDDAVSHSSKRSRSRDGHGVSRLSGHPCPACDATFSSPSSLRKHGRAPNVPEACRVAVEYDFE